MRIFVSYTMRDDYLNLSALREIEAFLRAHGSPYIDVLHNQGEDPQQHVVERLEEADLLVLCLTPGVLRSEWVQFELKFATDRRVPIIGLDASRSRTTRGGRSNPHSRSRYRFRDLTGKLVDYGPASG
ncbi:MAG: hypothetical protein AVDCRST_MAG68-4952 [uncultured Gemmatimonadetes bacterium]|uniref:TIR domain-containing protein n=1 Tax=uncultured Gemmatimonadota bacterium TaxID=203437 RepID=A0A6J4MRU2_9BACT|nr:MAG: hypothetical protein AVDCRST_MAG68-4952 [uncultured Gemmatimonadota bacterium]